MNQPTKPKRHSKDYVKFVVPSVIGVALFMLPVQVDGTWTVVVKVIADLIGSALGDLLPLICCLVITVSAILTLAAFARPKFIVNNDIMNATFTTTPIWAAIRVLGAVFVWLAFLGDQLGITANEDPAQNPLIMIASADTGGFVLGDLLTVLVIIFLLAGLLLPLLLDFGLLEFIGALMTRVMRPLFTIPGRSAVDCVTSWIGAPSASCSPATSMSRATTPPARPPSSQPRSPRYPSPSASWC